MNIRYMGWDIGGAHLKAAGLDGHGRLWIEQQYCPLWLGLDSLHEALARISACLVRSPGCRHAITMTGELADCFENRKAGVEALARVIEQHLHPDPVWFFSTTRSAHDSARQAALYFEDVASANWMASAVWASRQCERALLVDIGSTTTDIMLIDDASVQVRGYSDAERLRHGELLYSGVARTPLMALASHIPHDGDWIPVMAEHFATTADVYRLTGELSADVDPSPTADGREKSLIASARRLARMVGADEASFPFDYWTLHARFWRERHLNQTMAALERQLSRGRLRADDPLVGVGVGRFLVRACAERLHRPYQDFNQFFPHCISPAFSPADCAPAAALACIEASRNGFFDDDPN